MDYTNRFLLLAEQNKYLPTFGFGRNAKHSSMFNPYGKQLFTGEMNLSAENLLDIQQVTAEKDVEHQGKFLFCRVISPWLLLPQVSTIVDDPEGSLAVRLTLSYYIPPTTDLDAIVPVGSILGIRNPRFSKDVLQGFMVWCKNPLDDVKFEEPELEDLVPNLVFKVEVPEIYRKPRAASGGKKFDSLEKCKELGKVLFSSERFQDALNCYTKGLDSFEEDIDLLVNRAAVYMKLRKYNLALEDIEVALEKDKSHLKAIYCKTKTLCCLKKYDEAAKYLWDIRCKEHTIVSDPALKKLFMDVMVMNHQEKTGYYEMVKLAESKSFYHDQAEYIGPVRVDAVENKGRGLIAKEIILPGQLVIASKAFVVTFSGEIADLVDATIAPKDDLDPDIPAANLTIGLTCSKLIADIVNLLLDEPKSIEKFYELYAGSKFDTEFRSAAVDIERIKGICTHSAFSASLDWTEPKQRARGIWMMPAFLNHSCVDMNCFWVIYGDFMLVRAVKTIQEGEELLVSYQQGDLQGYETRRKIFQNILGFQCRCSLCLLEGAETLEERKANKRWFDLVKSNNVSELENAVRELETKNEQEPLLNYQHLPLLTKLASLYMTEQNLEMVKEVLLKKYEIFKSVGDLSNAIAAADNIVAYYLKTSKDCPDGQDKEKQELSQWISDLKDNLTLAYGTAEYIRVIDGEILRQIEAAGIDY